MARKELQHISLKSNSKKSPLLDKSVFKTAEDIEVKSTYSSDDTKDLEHINFVAGLAPNLRGPYSTMYVRRPWTIRQYAGFSTCRRK